MNPGLVKMYNEMKYIMNIEVLNFLFLSGHFTHFQVGGDNSKVEGVILQNKAGGKCN